jgi:hypothetical protein
MLARLVTGDGASYPAERDKVSERLGGSSSLSALGIRFRLSHADADTTAGRLS